MSGHGGSSTVRRCPSLSCSRNRKRRATANTIYTSAYRMSAQAPPPNGDITRYNHVFDVYFSTTPRFPMTNPAGGPSTFSSHSAPHRHIKLYPVGYTTRLTRDRLRCDTQPYYAARLSFPLSLRAGLTIQRAPHGDTGLLTGVVPNLL